MIEFLLAEMVFISPNITAIAHNVASVNRTFSHDVTAAIIGVPKQ